MQPRSIPSGAAVTVIFTVTNLRTRKSIPPIQLTYTSVRKGVQCPGPSPLSLLPPFSFFPQTTCNIWSHTMKASSTSYTFKPVFGPSMPNPVNPLQKMGTTSWARGDHRTAVHCLSSPLLLFCPLSQQHLVASLAHLRLIPFWVFSDLVKFDHVTSKTWVGWFLISLAMGSTLIIR